MAEQLRRFAESAESIELSGVRIGDGERIRSARVSVERTAALCTLGIAWIVSRGSRQNPAPRGGIDSGPNERRTVAIPGLELQRRRDG